MDTLLKALSDADFQWTTHIDAIWRDLEADIPELQRVPRTQLSARVSALAGSRETGSPLGVALLGTGGSGKTHLLSTIRREAMERGHYFVLVDMTDVRDFWDTVLLGYLRSLDQQREGRPQSSLLLQRIIQRLGPKSPTLETLTATRPPKLINLCSQLITTLASQFRSETREHQDVLRALILLSSDDFEIQDRGYQWLQGLAIGEDEAFRHDFSHLQKKPEQIVRGLSWLMSLDAPTVLALDQLDAIVAEHNLASVVDADADMTARQHASLAIIQGIAGGLSALRDVTRRTLIVVSSLEATWNILDQRAPVTMKDRFEPPLLLQPIRDAVSIRNLVERRLERAYAQQPCSPPYSSYPFQNDFFEERIGALPREVLKACNEHRHRCVAAGRVVEVPGKTHTLPPPGTFDDIEAEFQRLSIAADIAHLIEAEDEDALDRLVEAACEALIEENPLPSHLDVMVDRDFQGTGKFEPLHARLRVVDRSANDREKHYAFRILEKRHYRAFQSRLKAAMTCAGIGQGLAFRRLAVLRTHAIPTGAVSERLVSEFQQLGGRMIAPPQDELKKLSALHALMAPADQRAARTRQWLRERRIVSQLSFCEDAVAFLFQAAPASVRPATNAEPLPATPLESSANGAVPTPVDRGREAGLSFGPNTQTQQALGHNSSENGAAHAVRATAHVEHIEFGRKWIAGELRDPFSLQLDALTKHAVILAGAGSGKTVLIRRLVEETALAGIPSIVIDGANDLTRLGDAWPETPSEFDADDRAKMERYQRETEVVVWSPGRERGNPLRFEPLPDFAAVRGDADELHAAIDMARGSLEPIVMGTKVDKVRQGVLGAALRYFASGGGGSLSRFVDLLSELPPEANTGYEKGEKLAREAADRLRAEMETNPLFRGKGAVLDPVNLFSSRSSGKTRISVINLSGLPDQNSQQQFLNQLAMTLFSWIKKHPARGRALQGLLVIDEARDFVPSGKMVPGKDALMRLVAQARKYGLGIVFATQGPKSIEHSIIANCSTQFYGKQSSPAAIDTVREQLSQRGAAGGDVAKLSRGLFYVYSDGFSAPVKVKFPLCLSHHPASPPDEAEVLARAERSRNVSMK